jgi:hypothetical protein
MSELSRRAKPYGLLDTSDLGSGVNLTNFAGGGPSGEQIGGYMTRGMPPQNGIGPSLPTLTGAIREVVPNAGTPVGNVRTGPFVDNLAGWKAKPGSGVMVGKLLGAADEAPVLAKRLNNNLEIPKAVRDLAGRDQGMSAEYGLPMRKDVENLWRIVGEGRPDWLDRLRAAHARGEYLPAAALAALGLGAAAQNGDARSSGEGDH